MSLGAPGSLGPCLTDHEDMGKGPEETQEKGSLTSNSSREQKRAETW